MGVDLAMAAGCAGADLVHSHTWYANLAGHLAKLLHGVPHVVTAHSLEPLRPWKAEQLGGGYALSSWCERTAIEAADAVIAVSARDARRRAAPPTRRSTRTGSTWSTTASTPRSTPRTPAPTCWSGSASTRTGRSVVFVGRITRQKGLPLPAAGGPRAARRTPSWCCCAGAPDTAGDRGRGRRRWSTSCGATGDGVVWVAGDAAQARGHPGPHPRHGVRLPVDLRADGHRQPGGDGLRDGGGGDRDRRHPRGGGRRRDRACWCRSSRSTDGTGTPLDPDRFVADLAAAINELLADPARAARMGLAGRRRAVEQFSWAAIADRTLDVYRSVGATG